MTLKCKNATNPTRRPMSVPMKEALEDLKKMNNKVLRVIAKRGF
ncbi:hypothetical protein P9D39_19525 [Heyndrickxia oleronia]|nr:hypothetical protein [Heyndrickxia oleronia]MEC1376490.1 hypothetical protein [Heyndrickxia oleronia]